MAELCEACTRFIVQIADSNHSEVDGEEFTTCSQIESAAVNCPFCKVFLAALQGRQTKLHSSTTLQTRWRDDLSPRFLNMFWMDVPAPTGNIFSDLWRFILYRRRRQRSYIPLAPDYLITYQQVFDVSHDGDPDTDFSHRYPLWQPGLLTMKTRFKFVEACLSDCNRRHAKCRERMVGLPSRLLDLQDVENACIRLVDTTSLPASLPAYFTLSHCWGKDQPLKTTLSTLAAHQQSILVSDLPKTYSDAVKVTRHLGVQYLWIDSLCIVQDSKEDWEREAQAMAAIYQNSSLTISATSSADSYGGCYLEIDNATTEGISKPTREGHRYLVRLRRQVRREDLATPLLRRGWVFQETLLSRRVLHLTSNQMFWHCQERFRSEDGSISAESGSGVATYDVELGFCKKTTIGDHRLWVREHIWQRWCEDYSRRAFTYEEDKLPALAGLMSYIEKSTKSTPPLGLWMSTLHLDLAWRVNDTKKTSRLTGLPSWAWLSVRGGINYDKCYLAVLYNTSNPFSGTVVPLQVLDCHLKWCGAPYVSQLSSSRLALSSKFFLIKRNKAWVKNESFRVVGFGAYWDPHPSVTFDMGQKRNNSGAITCLVLFLSPSFPSIVSVVLEPTGQPDVYKRIGLCVLNSTLRNWGESFLAELDVKTVELV